MGSKENISVGILGLGTCVPDKVLTNFDLEKMVDTTNEWIVERSGIEARRIVDESEATSDLAVRAAKNALKKAGTLPEELDLIIVATATPDMLFPSTACIVQSKIGATKAAAFDLAAGCSGFVYGLITGSQFIRTGQYKRVLVIGAESLSRILDWTDRSTCVLFGDGSGAAVLGPVEDGFGIQGFNLGADGSGGEHLCLPAGGSRQPASEESVRMRKHYVHMNGNEVFRFAVKIMGEAAVSALEDAGLTSADVDFLVPHQANIRIIQSSAKRLKLPMEKVIVNLDKYGNTSSASIPLALEEAIMQERIKKGDIVVLVGFGAGLTWASCVLKWA